MLPVKRYCSPLSKSVMLPPASVISRLPAAISQGLRSSSKKPSTRPAAIYARSIAADPARRISLTLEITGSLKEICIGIGERYEIHFVEIGTDEDHVNFLVQSVPELSPKDIVQLIKSITGKEIFTRHPEVKKILWGGHIWTSGYYVNTVGRYGNEEVIAN